MRRYGRLRSTARQSLELLEATSLMMARKAQLLRRSRAVGDMREVAKLDDQTREPTARNHRLSYRYHCVAL